MCSRLVAGQFPTRCRRVTRESYPQVLFDRAPRQARLGLSISSGSDAAYGNRPRLSGCARRADRLGPPTGLEYDPVETDTRYSVSAPGQAHSGVLLRSGPLRRGSTVSALPMRRAGAPFWTPSRDSRDGSRGCEAPTVGSSRRNAPRISASRRLARTDLADSALDAADVENGGSPPAQSSRRPSIDSIIVASSTNSSSLPIGMPRPIRLTLTSRGLSSLPR